MAEPSATSSSPDQLAEHGPNLLLLQPQRMDASGRFYNFAGEFQRELETEKAEALKIRTELEQLKITHHNLKLENNQRLNNLYSNGAQSHASTIEELKSKLHNQERLNKNLETQLVLSRDEIQSRVSELEAERNRTNRNINPGATTQGAQNPYQFDALIPSMKVKVEGEERDSSGGSNGHRSFHSIVSDHGLDSNGKRKERGDEQGENGQGSGVQRSRYGD